MDTLGSKRAAIYGRYSTSLQDSRSIADQVRDCCAYAERNGITVVATYADEEKTSATLFDRHDLLRLMSDAKQRRFDLVLVESPSRLSRDTADLHRVLKHLNFHGVEIATLQGALDETQATVHGLVGSMFLQGLRAATRRGQRGRARDGKIMTGRVFGYRPVPGKPGEREIVPEEAAIIRRVFQEYIAGDSPRIIAKRLKDEGLPSPGRGGWSHQNINRGRALIGGGGIIPNEIYRGLVRYGRTLKVRNPDTGKCVNRPNRSDEPVVVDAPHLRIVDDATWFAAQRMMDSRTRRPAGQRPPWSKNNSILAGLCRCPCGAGMIVAQRSRDGSPRIKCSAAHFRDECEHTKSYDLPRLERAVLDALSNHLLSDETLEATAQVFLDEYLTRHREIQKQARQGLKGTATRLREIEAATQRLIAHLERGTMASEAIEERLHVLAVEKAALQERQRLAEAQINSVQISQDAITKYREAVAFAHQEMLNQTVSVESRMAFRNLVESITILPTPHRKPYEFKINGYLGALLGIDLYPAIEPVEKIVREAGGPCTDSVASASTARSCPPGTTPSCRPVAACGSSRIRHGSWRR